MGRRVQCARLKTVYLFITFAALALRDDTDAEVEDMMSYARLKEENARLKEENAHLEDEILWQKGVIDSDRQKGGSFVENSEIVVAKEAARSSQESKNPMDLMASIRGGGKRNTGRPKMDLMASIRGGGKGNTGRPKMGGLMASIRGTKTAEAQPSLSPAECCQKWEEAKVNTELDDVQKENFVREAGCPDFQSSICKSKEECCNVIWPTKKDNPAIVNNNNYKISIMARKGCYNFDENTCEPEEEEAFVGGSQDVVTFKETLTEGTWLKLKPKMKASSNKLLKKVAELVAEEKKLHTIGSVIFDDTFERFQTDGFIALTSEVTSACIQKWKELMGPEQFKTLFGEHGADKTHNIAAKTIAEILPQPDKFQRRLTALSKLFVMLHKPGGEFWKDAIDDPPAPFQMRWPTAMFAPEDVRGSDPILPGALDSIASTWAATCGSVECDFTLSCLDESTETKRCVPRKAISYDPSAGPLDKITWGVINLQWKCLSTPELVSQRQKPDCNVCTVSLDANLNIPSDCAAEAQKSFEEQQQKLGAWLHNRAITECKHKSCYAKRADWFEKLGGPEQAKILNQVSGIGNLDPVDVPGPLSETEKAFAAAKLAELTDGIDTETPFLAWLGSTSASDNFERRFVEATRAEKKAVFFQVVGIRTRGWKAYPQCPVGTTDCLGAGVQAFLQRDVSERSGAKKLYEDFQRASIQWSSTDAARTATQILEEVTIMSEEEERNQYKMTIDSITAQSAKTNGAIAKVQKMIYQGS